MALMSRAEVEARARVCLRVCVHVCECVWFTEIKRERERETHTHTHRKVEESGKKRAVAILKREWLTDVSESPE